MKGAAMIRLLTAVLAFAALGLGLGLAPAAARPRAQIAAPTEVAARFVADFAGQRAAAMNEYVAADAPMTVPFSAQGPQTLRGRAQTQGYFTQLFAKYAHITLSGVRLTPAADGHTVFIEALARYTNPAGQWHEVGNVWVIAVTRGLITSSRSYAIPVTPIPG